MLQRGNAATDALNHGILSDIYMHSPTKKAREHKNTTPFLRVFKHFK